MNNENLYNSAFSNHLLFNLSSLSGIAVWQEWYTECTASRIYSEDCTIQSALQFKRILYIESLEDSPKLLRRFIDGPWLLGLEPLTKKKPFLCKRIDCFLLYPAMRKGIKSWKESSHSDTLLFKPVNFRLLQSIINII